MNSNTSFNSDGMDGQNVSPNIPFSKNDKPFMQQQYFSQVPPQAHPSQVGHPPQVGHPIPHQQSQYMHPQPFVPMYGHSQYPPLAPVFDPMQVLRSQQQAYGGMDTQSFVKTMEFKKEQEISKQYSYKLEMLKLSMQANIPGKMIPQLFSNDSQLFKKETSGSVEHADINEQSSYSNSLPHPNSDVVLIDPHKQIRLQPVNTACISDYVEEANPETPLSSAGNLMPPSFKRQHKRTNSPSRIGELGVKELDKMGSVNESQENSRISSMNSNHYDEPPPALFKPKMRSFTNTSHSSVVSTAHNSRVSSIRHNPDQPVKINLNPTGQPSLQNNRNSNVVPPVGSFKPQHRRFNSLPSVLKPSPLIKTSKKSTNIGDSKDDNQTTEALLKLSQQKHASFLGVPSTHSRKRSYDLMNFRSREQIDLNRIENQDTSNLQYVVNKKFKFGNNKQEQQQNPFANISPGTDHDPLSNHESRTSSLTQANGNNNNNNPLSNKKFNQQELTANTNEDNNESNIDNNDENMQVEDEDDFQDHETTIEEDETNDNDNSDKEDINKKVQFVEIQSTQSQHSPSVKKRANTLESILN